MSEAKPQKGYVFAIAEDSSFYIPNALHVERDDELFLFADDEAAAKAAERDGVQLIHGMEDVPDGIYLDTPENRAAILDSLEKYPEYRSAAMADKQAPEMGLHFT